MMLSSSTVQRLPVWLADTQVLVVDDVRTMRQAMKMTLQNLGIRQTLEAESEEQAFDYLITQRPGLLITDWTLEKGHAKSLIQRFKAGQARPVIVVTGESPGHIVQELSPLTVNAILSKPIRPKDLLATLLALSPSR